MPSGGVWRGERAVQVETLQEESRSSKQQLVEACVVHGIFHGKKSGRCCNMSFIFFPKEKYQILEDLGRLKSHDSLVPRNIQMSIFV